MKQTFSQAEQKLLHKIHECEYFIESVTENTSDIIYVLEIETLKFTFLNKRVNEIMGAENMMLDRIYFEDVLERVKHISECVFLKKGETKDIKIRMKVKSGAWHWFHITDIPFKTNESGMVTHTIGVVRNIQSDMEREEILNGIFKTMSLGLVICKSIRNADNEISDFEFVLTSKMFNHFQKRYDLVGKQVFQEFPVWRLTKKENWIRVVEKGFLLKSEEESINPVNGEMHYFKVKAEKFNDGIMLIWNDITDNSNKQYSI
ncbi:MAG TPA: hypothetical protein VK177_04040 [Flavobacteriales bacterium]|nr:hypothetical protein [Flavobacteriales bacterium]